jgi:hypothetical protein
MLWRLLEAMYFATRNVGKINILCHFFNTVRSKMNGLRKLLQRNISYESIIYYKEVSIIMNVVVIRQISKGTQ